MKIAGFGVEEWLNVWEKKATYDIAQSTISSMTMQEVLDLDGENGKSFYDLLNKQKMNYGWIEGSPEFKLKLPNYIRILVQTIFYRPTGQQGPITLRYTPWLNRETT